MKSRILLITLLSFIATMHGYSQKRVSGVKPFLPNIISQFPSVRDLTISSRENEVYFTAQSVLGELSTIITCTLKDGNWSTPVVAPFSGMYHDLEPFLSPDGLRLYFVSDRPNTSDTTVPKNYDIWFVERTNINTTWSSPQNIGSPINTPENEFYPSVSISNNLYFTRDGVGSKGKDDIFFSKWEIGRYAIPISMSDSINSPGFEFNAFIAPDESFILFTCYNKKGGLGSGDLYISYHKENNEWTTAENLGVGINSTMMDYCPFVNMNSQTLYFTSRRSTVKTQYEKEQTVSDFLLEMNKYENGQSRVYQTPFNAILESNRKINKK